MENKIRTDKIIKDKSTSHNDIINRILKII